MRFLLADDDLVGRKSLESILFSYGECDCVVDGHLAVEAFAKAMEAGRPYDLVCLDIIMPTMSGHEALARIRNLEKAARAPRGWRFLRRFFRKPGGKGRGEVPVIMVSGLDDSQNIAQAYLEGAVSAYVTKPFDAKDFRELLSAFGIYEKKARRNVEAVL